MESLRKTLVAVLLLLSQLTLGQTMDAPFSKEDTLSAFTLDQFYQVILKNHPVVSQAELLGEMARQELRYARGSFDPKLISSADHKQFDKKTYYTKIDAAVSFPTWLPLNPKVGYQNHSGALLNAEEAIPGQEQIFAGVSVPIGKGLFTDERRTAVRQASQMITMAEADRVKVINKTLLEAAKDFWHWYFSFYQLRLLDQNLDLSYEILRRTRLNAEQGEAAGIDTIQAKINYQSRLVDWQEATVALRNAELQLSNYLWNENGEQVFIYGMKPVMTSRDSTTLSEAHLDSLLDGATRGHPELLSLGAKIKQIELEKSLAREMLKPQVDLNYFALNQSAAPGSFDLRNDFKFGVDFSIPVFLRKERSKVALADAKVTTARLQRMQREREIANDVKSKFYQFQNSARVIRQQTEVVNLYEKLMTAELLNLENGESDLFKINIQQEKLIQAQVKLLKGYSELQKERAELFWAAGNVMATQP